MIGNNEFILNEATMMEAVAFLMGNDRWKERNALNDQASVCRQEAARLKGEK